MAFPINPLNNEVAIVNNITYRYNISANVWNRIASSNVGFIAVTANTFIANNEVLINNVNILSYTQSAFNAANSASDSYARTTANTASNNITIIQGVNTTQNTNITAADTKAQAAFDKANTSITTSGGTIDGSLSVTGNLTVLGATTTINTSSFTVNDSLLTLGVGNYTSDLLDIGFSGHYNDGTNAHSGIIRDHGTKEWYVFKGYTPELTANNNININDASFAKANINADYFKGNVVFSDGTTQSSAATGIDSYARTTANTKLSLSGGTIAGNVTANSVIANNSIYAPTFYSTGATSKLDLTDIGLVSVSVASQEFKFGAAGIESSPGIYGGSFGGNKLSLNNETNLISDRYDTVKIQTGTTGTAVNEWSFSNNRLIFPDNTYQNTAFTDAQVTNITAADTKAQAAFDQANAALTLANTANTTASSGGSGGSGESGTFTTYIDKFTGNGSQTQFTLSTTPDSENQTMVFLNGVYQNKDTYSISGSNIIFTDTASANDTIEITTFVRVTSIDTSMYKTRTYQGDSSTNTFTISSGHTANTILVFNNGVAQFPIDDYIVSGTTVTYVLAPEPDETIQIRELPINTLVPTTQSLMRRYTANGAQTQFTVTSGQTANSLLVFENGICQVPVNDYTVSNTTLTFVTAPIANVVVQIRELSI